MKRVKSSGHRKLKPDPALGKVFAPTFVARPPSDAYIGLAVLEDGELRHYNYGEQRDETTWYIFSRDGGLTWRRKAVPRGMTQREMLTRADTRDPITGEYLRLTGARHVLGSGAAGTAMVKSSGGHGGTWSARKALPARLSMLKPPVFIRGGKRIIVPTGVSENWHISHVVMAYSDDHGRSWKLSGTCTIPEPKDWRKHARWNHGPCEPTVVELRDGTLWTIMRTGRDNFWEAFSGDGGEIWSRPRPSRFFACKTMPTIARLSDGRILMSWCNTTPLPCLPRSEVTRILMGNVRNYGINTDMFTNRDACHLAISDDDGRSWTGFRELFLDPRRNAGDYAMTGGIDRGMHQSQFVELGDGKILISFGQHWLHRSMAVFDVGWLYEKSRTGRFASGLDDWSVQTYFVGVQGHRALNRKSGAELVRHPDSSGRRVMRLARPEDPEVISANQGATWNFPAGKAGSFATRVMPLPGCGGFCVSLLDRWFNPTDLVAPTRAMYALRVRGSGKNALPGRFRAITLEPGRWSELRFEWDGLTSAARHPCRLFVNGAPAGALPLNRAGRNGVSYAHFISTAAEHDPHGFLVESVAAEAR
jgi:hypothetical protein